MTWLKANTAQTIVIGPVLDSVDATAETGLTITQSEILLWKQGGSGFSAKNDATAATHRSNGLYTVPLDATDTLTEGQLIVTINKAGTIPFANRYQVVPINVWNSIINGSDKLLVDAVEINSNTTAASNLSTSAQHMLVATVSDSGHTPTTTACKLTGFTEATDDHFIGRVAIFTSGALKYQATSITDYTGATQVITYDTLTEAPANGDTLIIV